MILEFEIFVETLPPDCRILGLDLGSKTIGLALSDPAGLVASPLTTIKRRKFTRDAESLEEIIRAREVGALVLGLPVNMDGSEGARCQSTRQFARNMLKRGLDLPISFWDERLSTVAVERFLIDEADMSRAKRSDKIDKMAAGFILQGALEHIQMTRRNQKATSVKTTRQKE